MLLLEAELLSISLGFTLFSLFLFCSEEGEEFVVENAGWKQFHIFLSTNIFRAYDKFNLRRKQGNEWKPLEKGRMRYQQSSMLLYHSLISPLPQYNSLFDIVLLKAQFFKEEVGTRKLVKNQLKVFGQVLKTHVKFR